VLVVDDEESMRDSCAQVLGRDGFEVLGASGGDEALDMMARRRPDVLLVDLKMPGMSGQEFLERAKEDDPEVAAVVITGYATLESAVDVMKSGATDVLAKPFKAGELRAAARAALANRRLSRAASTARRERDRMRDHFVAMVSHQLKSPLASLKECLDAAASSYADEIPERCRDLLARAGRKSSQLLALLDDWLTLSKMESTGALEEAEPVDLDDLVRRVIDEARERLACHDVDVEYSLEGGAPRVKGDREALAALFSNLIENALRYTPDGGKVTVTLSGEAGAAHIGVSDTGPGIPPEELGLVFERFYRGEKAREQDGTGLGLAIAREIAESHGGHISAESEPGKGSTFKVYLPAEVAG